MKIVSWNLNQEIRPGAWPYLADELRADLALVQEALPNEARRGVYRPSGIAGRDGKARRWGSAVVALSDEVRIVPVGLAEGTWRGRRLGLAPLECVSRGHVAVARVEAPGLVFTAISAYGLMEFGYASGTLLRTIADLEPLLDDPVLGDNVVIAGDWNIGPGGRVRRTRSTPTGRALRCDCSRPTVLRIAWTATFLRTGAG